MTELEILDRVLKAGAGGVLLFALFGGFKGWYVWKRELDFVLALLAKVERDRDDWKEIARSGLGVGKIIAEERATPRPHRGRERSEG